MYQWAYQHYDVVCQNGNQGYWKRKHARSKKDKNSYAGYFHVHIKTDVFRVYTTKSLVSPEKDYEIWSYPSRMAQLFGFYVDTAEKHIDNDFQYLRSVQLGQICKELSCIDQLVALQVETQEVDSCNQILRSFLRD